MTSVLTQALQAALNISIAADVASQPAPTPLPVPQPVVTAPPPPVPSGVPSDIHLLPRTGGNIFEFGDLFTYPAPNSGAPHTDYVVNGQTIKNHYWGSRWYDGKFVVKNKISDLISSKLVPPFKSGWATPTAHIYSGNYDTNGLPNPFVYNGPMDYKLAPYMGQTGDQSSIGPFNEWESARIASGDASLDSSIEALARNILTLPIHVRDPKTGRPVSYKDYPQFSVYAGQENSMIAPGLRTGILGWTPTPPGIVFDAAHHPQFCYLTALMTDDPVWLEELQYLATFCWSFDFPENTIQHEDNLQVREMAWDMMTLVNVISLTRYFEKKGLLPDSCHPSQYFVDVMLTPTIKWLSSFTGDSSPLGFSKVLMWAPYVYAPWQWDFFGLAVACGIYYGITELQPIFNWVASGIVERLTGKQGWNPDYPTLYYISSPQATWKDSWAEVVKEDAGYATPTPAGSFFPTLLMNDYQDYVGWLGAVTRMGKLIGHPDLTALYPALEQRIVSSGIARNYRHSIGG